MKAEATANIQTKVNALFGNNLKARLLFEKAKSKNHWGALLFRLGVYVLLIDLSFIFLYPFLYIISYSLKTGPDMLDVTIRWIPRSMHIENYKVAYEILKYPMFLKNSSILALLPTVGHIISASLVGYGFARFKFKGKEILFMLAMFTLIIPPQSIIIPLYIQYKTFGWMDSYLPIIVPSFLGAGLKGALYIFIFRQTFRGLPMDLEDAARIDGCGSFMTYLKIVLPLSKPAMLVTSILSIVWHWNDYFEPQVYLNTQDKFTLPMLLPGLASAYDQFTGGMAHESFNWPLVVAAVAMVMMPMIVLYLIMQRQFMKGIERTGLTE